MNMKHHNPDEQQPAWPICPNWCNVYLCSATDRGGLHRSGPVTLDLGAVVVTTADGTDLYGVDVVVQLEQGVQVAEQSFMVIDLAGVRIILPSDSANRFAVGLGGLCDLADGLRLDGAS